MDVEYKLRVTYSELYNKLHKTKDGNMSLAKLHWFIFNNGRSIFHKSYTIHRRHHCNIYTEVLHARADANTTADIDKIIADTHANTNGEHAATDIDTNAIANTSTIGVLMKRDIVNN
ncbi:hypothetical protein glysoja_008876 [Glycine soja]|nr:hypothetical protein glysoja_008876 [Glycine soja]